MVENVQDSSEKAIIVIGAYRGSSITRLFLKSTAIP
jgi:nucleotide-binding universal stress UspA family protein